MGWQSDWYGTDRWSTDLLHAASSFGCDSLVSHVLEFVRGEQSIVGSADVARSHGLALENKTRLVGVGCGGFANGLDVHHECVGVERDDFAETIR